MQETGSIEFNNTLRRKAVSSETYIFLGVTCVIFGFLGSKLGIGIMFSIMMKTAHDLILNTAIFIMGVAVLAGALAALLSEFGVIALVNKLLAPVMKPLFGLPGAASLGAVTTYISDNPAILSLVEDQGFSKYFKKYQLVSLVNLGTVFGMGLIVTSYVLGLGSEYIPAIIVGNIAAILGGIISVRLMLIVGRKEFNEEKGFLEEDGFVEYRTIREGSIFQRVLGAMLEGGKSGVDLGLSVIPGILVVCTTVMMLTFGPSGMEDGVAVYTGAAYEGIGLLPKIGEFFSFILTPLFGFQSTEALALPITSLGAVGAAMGMAKGLLEKGLIGAHDIAVFSAMGICWAGFMSTHIGLMDALGSRKLAGKAMITHLIGGVAAGVFANYIFKIFIN